MVSFILGLIVGIFVGITLMCIISVNKNKVPVQKIKETKFQKV